MNAAQPILTASDEPGVHGDEPEDVPLFAPVRPQAATFRRNASIDSHRWLHTGVMTTARSCLESLYRENPSLAKPKNDPTDPTDVLLISHDAHHFIFGCGTDIEGEFALQVMLATMGDHSISALAELYNRNPSEADAGIRTSAVAEFGELPFGAKASVVIRLLRLVGHGLWFRLTRRERFPILGTVSLLDIPLEAVRARYGIIPYSARLKAWAATSTAQSRRKPMVA